MALTAGESAYSPHLKIPVCHVIWGKYGVWRVAAVPPHALECDAQHGAEHGLERFQSIDLF